MRICSLLLLLVALTRCAPEDACVRLSDCDDGTTCRRGVCEPNGGAEAAPPAQVDAAAPADARVVEAGLSEAGPRDAARADADDASSVDASTP